MFSNLKKKIRRLIASEVRKQVNLIFKEQAHDIKIGLQRRALEDTIDLIISEDYPIERMFNDRFALLKKALGQVELNGLILEFGVYKGSTINFIAKQMPDKIIHGFDSFEGLTEPWIFRGEGAFGEIEGAKPDVCENITLHKGYFQDTLPTFLEKHTDPVSFLHIDSDLYSSARYILSAIKSRLKVGSVIVFDEFFNYPKWQHGEFKAWNELLLEIPMTFEVVGFTFQHRLKMKSGNQVCFKITSMDG